MAKAFESKLKLKLKMFAHVMSSMKNVSDESDVTIDKHSDLFFITFLRWKSFIDVEAKQLNNNVKNTKLFKNVFFGFAH